MFFLEGRRIHKQPSAAVSCDPRTQTLYNSMCTAESYFGTEGFRVYIDTPRLKKLFLNSISSRKVAHVHFERAHVYLMKDISRQEDLSNDKRAGTNVFIPFKGVFIQRGTAYKVKMTVGMSPIKYDGLIRERRK